MPKLTLSPLPHTACLSTVSFSGPTKRLQQKPCLFFFSLMERLVRQRWQTWWQIRSRETRSLLAQTSHWQPSLGVHCPWPALHSWCPRVQPRTEGDVLVSHTLLPQFLPPENWGCPTLRETRPQALTIAATQPTSGALKFFYTDVPRLSVQFNDLNRCKWR